MYLSRIRLDTASRQTIRGLAAPNVFHGAVESAEAGERSRKLWRVDKLHGESYLLILSEREIDFSGVCEQFGYGGRAECKCYDSLLERVTDGSRWQFRLTANPTVQLFDPNKKRGRVLAHITTEHQANWLLKQAEKNGFSLDKEQFLVTASKWYEFKRNRNEKSRVHMLAVTYEGILTVTDAEKFRNALTAGIGREKAFGMGMLTVAGIK